MFPITKMVKTGIFITSTNGGRRAEGGWRRAEGGGRRVEGGGRRAEGGRRRAEGGGRRTEGGGWATPGSDGRLSPLGPDGVGAESQRGPAGEHLVIRDRDVALSSERTSPVPPVRR